MAASVAVVGLLGGEPVGKAAGRALEAADLVVGGRHQLDACRPPPARTLAIEGALGPVLDAVAAEPGRVCVLASGDPGFFGVVRALARRLGPGRLEVHPAPSSVALAFARLGLPWDDATVVSAHGRPLAEAAAVAAGSPKAAVLVSPGSPPEALGRALLDRGTAPRQVAVCARLGEPGERVDETDLEGLAAGTWDARSVVVLVEAAAAVAPAPTLAWGRPEAAFASRGGMVTKGEVRAVALGKLALPPSGVLWDVGAGSGYQTALLCELAARVCAVELVPELAGAAAERLATLGYDNVLVVVGDEAGTPTGPQTFDLGVTDVMFTDLGAIARGSAETRASESVPAGGDVRYLATTDPGNLFDLTVTGTAGVDVVVEATGAMEHGTRVILDALEGGRHVVSMNAEVDALLGHHLDAVAAANGATYSI
ncbi:MAG: precorrin-6y C5,15-methyltransferase (decarboxylating) subunit CbiE, partial [Actinobacteria bacterium]|nr:precorrin-6y C5,15-methyltransferase (decarboxylating) subunit CbiE [Actinomycetota bacterium]